MKLAKFIYERVEWGKRTLEDGLTRMGYVEIILGENEEQLKEDFEFGASEDWLQVSDEFKTWRDSRPRTAQVTIMRTLFEECEVME